MIDKVLRVVALSPPALVTFLVLSRMDISNPFVAVGMLSLVFIASTDRFKWVSIVLVYIPAIYAVYLLLTGVISPFLGLAAGYVISTPFVLIISAYRSIGISGLITGFYTSYVFALLLYGIVAGGNVQPERLFLTLIRTLVGMFSQEKINITPVTPEPTMLYNILTAVATISLLLSFAMNERSSNPLLNQAFVKGLVIVLAASVLVSSFSDLLPTMTSYVLLGSIVAVFSFMAVKMRGKE